MNWEKVNLRKVCNIQSGGTPSRSIAKYWVGNIPWAKISDIEKSNGFLIKTKESISSEGLNAIGGRIFPAGTLLFAIYGSVGKTAFTDIRLSTNQAILGITPIKKDTIDLRFLQHWFVSQQRNFNKDARGVTQKNLSATYLRDLEIPLPPLPEQKRIAAFLDKAEGIRRKREEALQLADEFLRATFLEMFGDPVTNPKGWEVQPFRNVVENIVGGWSVKALERPAQKGENGVLKISSVTLGRFRPSENKAVLGIASDKMNKMVVPSRGDLLFSRANTRELVAATCIVEEDVSDLFLPDKLWKISPNTNRSCSEYLKYLLSHRGLKKKLTKQATGTSGSMLNISKEKLNSFEIPVPPINRQMQFSKLFWNHVLLKRKHEFNFKSSIILLNSLTQRAFRGELYEKEEL